MIWRVMLSSKHWDHTKYERLWEVDHSRRRLPQSKGNKSMKYVPQQGDTVYFIFKQKIVMKGIFDSDGFEVGNNHQIHPCNIGTNREHSIASVMAWINITEVGLSEAVRLTGQQTWILWKEDMRI
jgi:hypothetical protein